MSHKEEKNACKKKCNCHVGHGTGRSPLGSLRTSVYTRTNTQSLTYLKTHTYVHSLTQREPEAAIILGCWVSHHGVSMSTAGQVG